ncbi:MAG: nuclear transport factor 2 family protein [bacterium]|nr:nuclear transport factor 2 family protein [bacterium]
MLNQQKNEKQELLNHIHQIFQAFLDRDRDRIRELHTDDWVGFLGPSKKIERGIDDYMLNADLSLENFRGTGYEIHDSEIQIEGDLGLVFYVASYFMETEDGKTGIVPLRSIDIFRRRDGKWNQAGSHISVIPNAGKWGE